MNPETPRRTGVLIKSATLGTVIGSGEINQIAPYARRQYYEHKEKSYWFERMKNRHKAVSYTHLDVYKRQELCHT